jgi:hypothetical protein
MQMQFNIQTNRVQDRAHEEFRKYNQLTGNMAQLITASRDKATEFPFVRVPKFELLSRHTRVATSATVMWAPFVTESQRTEWSNFSTAKQGWYDESVSILRSDPAVDLHRFANDSKLRDYIWEGELSDGETAVTSHGPYAPLWQISPPTPFRTAINFNVLHEQSIKDLLPSFIQTNDFVMSNAKFTSDGFSSIIGLRNLNSEESSDHPYAIHLTPVFESLNDVKSPLVGLLLSTMFWADFLKKVFHHSEQGITAVLRNTCHQVFTYVVQGGQVRSNR